MKFEWDQNKNLKLGETQIDFEAADLWLDENRVRFGRPPVEDRGIIMAEYQEKIGSLYLLCGGCDSSSL
jgi:uncharacterized DUF497 family protein